MSRVWYGSVSNRIMERATGPEKLEVGMGVTKCLWSDRKPYEIVDIQDERHITVRALDYERVDKNGCSDSQEYEYYSNDENHTCTLFKKKDGRWVERIGRKYGRDGWFIGKAERYYDYSF